MPAPVRGLPWGSVTLPITLPVLMVCAVRMDESKKNEAASRAAGIRTMHRNLAIAFLRFDLFTDPFFDPRS